MGKRRYFLLVLVVVFLVSFTGIVQALPQQTLDSANLTRQAAWDGFSQIVELVKAKNFPLAPETARDLVAGNPANYLIVDLRLAEDYAKGHVSGAVNIPFAKLPALMDQLPGDKVIMLYCYSGQQSALASTPLKALGYTVFSLARGFGAVEKAGFPTDTAASAFKPAAPTFMSGDSAALAVRRGISETFEALTKQMAAKTLIVDGAVVKPLLAENPANFVVVDLRALSDYYKGHVSGAISIPLAQLREKAAGLPRDKIIVVYCYSGQTAALTLLPLKAEGYDVISIRAGFAGVEQSGLPIESSGR
jgi:rhodanese-related sulfurtransferase